MSGVLSGLLRSSSSLSKDTRVAADVDDHDEDGSREHTRLLSSGPATRHSKSNNRKGDKDDDNDNSDTDGYSPNHNDFGHGSGSNSASNSASTNPRQESKHMVHSLYASSKESSSHHRQSSVPGPPSNADYGQDHGASPLFINNVSGLWDSDNRDNDRHNISGSDGGAGVNMRSGSNLILEDASPPLPWKEPSHPFASREDLSLSQRFSMDAISDGGSVSDSQQLTPLTGGFSDTNMNIAAPTASEPKKKRWGPKAQKATSALTPIDNSSTHVADVTTADKDASSTLPSQDASSVSLLFGHAAAQPTSADDSAPDNSTSRRDSYTRSSIFALPALSRPSMGIVSGLNSLKNSIMIPAMPTSSTVRTERTNDSHVNSLANSQSSLDFVVEDNPPPRRHRQHTSTSSSRATSPSLLRSGYLTGVDGLPLPPVKDVGSSTILFDRKQERSKRDLTSTRATSPEARRSTPGSAVNPRSASALSSSSQHYPSRRQHVANQNSAARSLAALESEFQQLVHKQNQLSAHKVELCTELLSLYSRRNTNEAKQEEAAKSEQFEVADSAATTIRHVQERIQKLEGIYAETDRSLWKCKTRQDELGRSVSEMHQAVMQEMEQMRQTREKERDTFQNEMQAARASELGRIQNSKDEIVKETSDLALVQDFLGKNEAELMERMKEETKVEQTELDGLTEERDAVRAEIQELTRRLEQLHAKDKELSRNVISVEQKISSIAQQFDGKAKEVLREKRELERRTTDMQQKTLRLERHESNLQRIVREAEAHQDDISGEIQDIVSQQDRLEQVRRLFEAELVAIQRLRIEEEAFREKEAGWTMRARSLSQSLRKYELQLEALTNQSAANQQEITNLELDLEAIQKRIGTIESFKTLSVQRRDFKQASHYSAELAKCRESLAVKQAELDRLVAANAVGGAGQEEFETVQKEYEKTQSFVKEEEMTLYKEIKATTTEVLARLENISIADGDSKGKDKANTAASETTVDVEMPQPSAVQLSSMLLIEMRREIESMCEMARIQFGREEAIPGSSSQHLRLGEIEGAEQTIVASEGVKEQEQVLDRDIHAAVAEEDYERAAELQAQLDALRSHAR
ncbi:hypothetical protein BGZ99_008836 [Dissophora globulifera]|uniref:UVR domain-containing protein n=1 Tax=Dissophora globulifera TaxID=979702 RepID=A0A9P6R8I5_9FUNG|nr:hypothetical protein BGZ99_008836 [Dissophora globulifera]